MGNRLCVNIVMNNECICALYYQHGADSDSSFEVLRKLIPVLTSCKQSKKDIQMAAIRFCEKTIDGFFPSISNNKEIVSEYLSNLQLGHPFVIRHGGLSIQDRAYAINSMGEDFLSSETLDRNCGLVAIQQETMESYEKNCASLISIDLSNSMVDFGSLIFEECGIFEFMAENDLDEDDIVYSDVNPAYFNFSQLDYLYSLIVDKNISAVIYKTEIYSICL